MDSFSSSAFRFLFRKKLLLKLLQLLCFISLLILLHNGLPNSTMSVKSGLRETPHDFLQMNTKLNETNAHVKFIQNYNLAYAIGSLSQDSEHIRAKHFICPIFRQQLGNQMFQYASSYGIAMLHNMSVIVGTDDEVTKLFKIDADIRENKTLCLTTKMLRERWACAFDNKLLYLNRTENYTLGRWLQSWKYFIDVADKLRKQFVFKDHIRDKSENIIQSILSKRGLNRASVTLVGVHVRRGDKSNTNRGDQVASKGYIQRAMKHYQSAFSNTFFLVCSDTIVWCRENIDRQPNVEFIEKNTKEVDLSILASCDHIIQTVGTFGWWAAWLAGGTSIYFKWPAREGSHIRKSFSKDFSDFFYPGWIGMA